MKILPNWINNTIKFTYFNIIVLVIVLLIPSIVIGADYYNTKMTEIRSNRLKEELYSLEPTKPVLEYKSYAFKINNQIVFLSEKELYTLIYDYIKENVSSSKNNHEYISRLTKSYIRLFDKCKDNDRVLMYIALCKVESNFNCKSLSHCGAHGIPQVMLSVWYGVMRDKWGISVNQYKNDLYAQLYVGWKIYDIYYKKNKGNIVKAHQGYNGSKGTWYHNRVLKQYKILLSRI